jgi:hypothetical protein
MEINFYQKMYAYLNLRSLGGFRIYDKKDITDKQKE